MVEPESVAAKVGVTPATAFPFLFLRLTVTVELEAPSDKTGPVPEIDEFDATAT